MVDIQRIQIVSIILSILFLAGVFEATRKRKIKDAYSIVWIISGIVFLFFSIWRGALDKMSHFIGIAYPPAAMFFIILLAILIMLFHFSLIISELKGTNVRLIQEIGILKAELEQVKKTAAEPNGSESRPVNPNSEPK